MATRFSPISGLNTDDCSSHPGEQGTVEVQLLLHSIFTSHDCQEMHLCTAGEVQTSESKQVRDLCNAVPGYYTLSHTSSEDVIRDFFLGIAFYLTTLPRCHQVSHVSIINLTTLPRLCTTVSTEGEKEIQRIAAKFAVVWMATRCFASLYFLTSVLVRCTAAQLARNSLANTSLRNESSDSV